MNQSTHFSGQPIFAQILRLIPPGKVAELAGTHGSDHYYKTFKTYDHLVTMLYAVFNRCTSLREVITGMMAAHNRLTHLGLRHTPRRSTLADANQKRDPEVFGAIFDVLSRTYRSRLPDSRSDNKWVNNLFMIDSTTISLFQEILKNAGRNPANGKRKGGIKAHMLVKADEDVPCLVRLTAAAANDQILLKEIDVPQGSILVFDRAYADYGFFAACSARQVTFVTRLKTNAIYEHSGARPLAEDQVSGGVRSDSAILLGGVQLDAQNKIRARLIAYHDRQSGHTFDFLTNNFELSPLTIAAIYRRRWQIELLFKRLKQNYPLRSFLGDNENAIRTQIWCALIADLLLMVIKSRCPRNWSSANLAGMVRLHLMTYINLRAFLQNPEKALLQANQKIFKDHNLSLFPT